MITSSKIVAIGLEFIPVSILGVISDQVQMAIIAAITAIVTAIPAIMIALRGTNKKIDDLGDAVNGRLTKLLEETSKAQRAEGKLEGKAEEKSETAAASKPTLNPPTL